MRLPSISIRNSQFQRLKTTKSNAMRYYGPHQSIPKHSLSATPIIIPTLASIMHSLPPIITAIGFQADFVALLRPVVGSTVIPGVTCHSHLSPRHLTPIAMYHHHASASRVTATFSAPVPLTRTSQLSAYFYCTRHPTLTSEVL